VFLSSYLHLFLEGTIMSVVYRIVKRHAGHSEGKEMSRGIVETLRDVMENLPVIVVKRSNKPHGVYVYEVQVWSTITNSWMCYLPLEPWTAPSEYTSLSSLIFATDVPLVDPDAPSLTFRDVPLTGMDIPPIPRIITPAVTYI
jgi:hypothetical protein